MLVVRPRRQLHTPHTRRRVSWMTQKLSLFGTFTRLLVFVGFVYPYRMSDQGGGASGIDLTLFATPPRHHRLDGRHPSSLTAIRPSCSMHGEGCECVWLYMGTYIVLCVTLPTRRHVEDKTDLVCYPSPRTENEHTYTHTRTHSHTHTHEHSLSVTPQEMVQDPEYEHLKLEKKCCDQGCLAGGLLFDPSLRPIVSKAKRLKTEASATGNQTTVPLHGHNRGGSRLVNEKESIMTTPLLLRAYGFRSSVTW